MSTKAAVSQSPDTDQARTTFYDGLKSALSSISQLNSTMSASSSWAFTPTACNHAVYAISEKAMEANRQVERVKSLKALCGATNSPNPVQIESISSAIDLIGSFFSSSFPIPVASSGSDGGTTLFIESDDFYGDIEIRGKSIEYYLKSKRNDEEFEVFDNEELESGYIPPNLLISLFTHYAR